MEHPLLELKQVECRHRGVIAVENLNLHVNQGDLVCLLGPSGCGKTTVLRAIAGFHPLHSGEIRLHDRRISAPGYTLAPEKRRLGMVFQDYALFPHLDVSDNIRFGLRDLDKKAGKRVAREMLEIVGLPDMGDRYIHELSGGQQQRVALARALAPQPELILMDEPFSNLDIEMRERLSGEVRQILKNRGTSGILVTHDQHEAFAMGDQIGVMSKGHILQRDTAYNLYHSPANRFVADFIGQGVFVRGRLLSPDTVDTPLGTIHGDRAYEWEPGTEVELLMRPDDIVYDPQGDLQAEVVKRAFKGAEILYTLKLQDGTEVLSLFPSHYDFTIGQTVSLGLALDHMVVFPL